MKRLLLAACALTLIACQANSGPKADVDLATNALKVLSDDAMQGRQVGTEGGMRAIQFLETQITGLKEAPERQPFSRTVERRGEVREINGINLLSRIPGRTPGEGPELIVMAHFDHVGVQNGEIYNGADDNASGTGALLAIYKSFLEDRPEHDVLIAYLDGEEFGLTGARHLVETLTDGRPRVALNMDMISQNQDGIIYASGTYHTPAMQPLVERAAQGVDLDVRFGHDRPEEGSNDWSLMSDHGPFHAAGVPFLYFGVEDHEHYHQPTDDFETIPLPVYHGAVQLSVNTAHLFDAELDKLAKPLEAPLSAD